MQRKVQPALQAIDKNGQPKPAPEHACQHKVRCRFTDKCRTGEQKGDLQHR